jgi:glycosyl transferase family 1
VGLVPARQRGKDRRRGGKPLPRSTGRDHDSGQGLRGRASERDVRGGSRAVLRRPPFEYVSGKCLSSRHIDAAGTKTCQLLLEGGYNGILRADEHYVEVRLDLSNLDEAIKALVDDGRRAAVVDRAYEHVLDGHTYAHRMTALLSAIGP